MAKRQTDNKPATKPSRKKTAARKPKAKRKTKPKAKPKTPASESQGQSSLPDDGLSSAFHKPPVSPPLAPAVSAPSPEVSTPQPPAVSAPESGGLVCRRCSCRHFIVRNTVPTARGVKRYRACRNCGRPLTTIEKTV